MAGQGLLTPVPPFVLGNYQPDNFGQIARVLAVQGLNSNIWPTANRAFFMPIVVKTPCVAQRLSIINGAAVSGNFDIGIYNSSYLKIASTGSTAQATINVIQSVDIADVALTMGRYWLALVFDNTTAQVNGIALTGSNPVLRLFGGFQQDTAFPLPSTPTPAVWASTRLPWIFVSTGRFV